MTTTIDKNQWCGQFKRCNGCKLQSECMVKPEEMFPVMEDGKYVDKWAIRTMGNTNDGNDCQRTW